MPKEMVSRDIEVTKRKIKNEKYLKFLSEGIIDLITEEQLSQALKNVKGIRGKYKEEGRSLLIMLYYTGARPSEILELKAKDVTKEKSYVKVKLIGKKGGLPRTMSLRYRNEHIREFYDYSLSLMPEMFMFFNYKNRYIRTWRNKKGELVEYVETSDKVRHHVYKWLKNVIIGGVPPYYFRHNCFSKLSSSGVDLNDIRLLKGARTIDSVMPYIHMSSKKSEEMAKKLS